MSLAGMLLNGGSIGSVAVSESYMRKYGHDSASLIAMESVEELHEVFIESFYNVEQAEIAAHVDGVALEGSQYEAVVENAVTNAFAKVKDFFKKLWSKVKGYLANIRRMFDAIFMNTTDFAKKYEKQVMNLTSVGDYKVTMYEYNDSVIDGLKPKGKNVEENATAILLAHGIHMDKLVELTKDDELKKKADAFGSASTDYSAFKSGNGADDIPDPNDSSKTVKKSDGSKVFSNTTNIAAIVTKAETVDTDKLQDEATAAITKELFTASNVMNSYEDLADDLFKLFRDSDKEDDKPERDLTNRDIEDFLAVLLKSRDNLKVVTEYGTASDKAYKKAIDKVDALSRAFTKAGVEHGSKVIKVVNLYSKTLSMHQTVMNKCISAWKEVIRERDAAYKAAIVGAFSAAKREAKK